jgi:transcription antitermination factor NusA-like protein
MVNTIDMKDLRHLNLFSKVTKIQTRYCFSYNDILMFCVPKSQVSRALGNRGENLKKISDVLKKRIRILPIPRGVEDAETFIQSVINPVTFKEIEINPEEIIVNAGPQSKAALLGRHKRRLAEMQEIVKDFFGLNYKVI